MNILIRLGSFVLIAGLSQSIGVAQQGSTINTMADCAEDLQIPREGPSGKSGDRTGPVVVTVVPDSTGHPSSISIDRPSGPAARLTRSWIASSTFAKKCAGQRIVLQFSFVVEGAPIEYAFTWVTFRGPNHFIIHSRPRIPQVFYGPQGWRKERKE